jgi:hypothetical protein
MLQRIDIERLLLSDLRMRGVFRAGLPVVLSLASAGCSERSVSAPSPGPSAPVVLLTEPSAPEVRPDVRPEMQELPPVETNNKSALVTAAGAGVVVTASSTYPGWPMSNATDGNVQTSWYSNKNDSAAKGTSPFIQLEFSEPSTVRRVTILGNRDPSYLLGYTILSGRLDVYDTRERLLASMTSTGTGNRRDFDFRLEVPAQDAKIVRFTSLADEGGKNPYGDVAIAELQVE